MFIVIFKFFWVNDCIIVCDMGGVIEDIILWYMVICNFENCRIIILNVLISDEIVVNVDFVDGKICKWVEVLISYESNVDWVKEIMCEEVMVYFLFIDVCNVEQVVNNEFIVQVRVLVFQDFGMLLRVWCWIDGQVDFFVLGCDLYESIKKCFDWEGIEIFYLYCIVVQKVKVDER